MKLDLSNKPRFMDEAIVFRTQSESRSGLFHYTVKLRHGGVICTCEGWQFRGSCKHTLAADFSSPEVQAIIAGWRVREKPDPEALRDATQSSSYPLSRRQRED